MRCADPDGIVRGGCEDAQGAMQLLAHSEGRHSESLTWLRWCLWVVLNIEAVNVGAVSVDCKGREDSF